MELFILFILFRDLFNSFVFYGKWLFIVGEKWNKILLYTGKGKMDFNNSVLMEPYHLAFKTRFYS